MSHTDILHQIRQIGRQVLPEDAHLLLYGSRARGDYRENSDWDLLVLLNRPQEASDFQNIAYPIMELGFDLGGISACKPIRKRNGRRCVFCLTTKMLNRIRLYWYEFE